MNVINRIGILNGGGDCPGLNAVTRAVVRSSTYRYGWEVMEIFDSFDGLIWPEKTKPLRLAPKSCGENENRLPKVRHRPGSPSYRDLLW